MDPFNNILIVCVGNICRSPVGAALLKRLFPNKHIHSAGVAARLGKGVDPAALNLAKADGLDLSNHRARQINEAMVREADLILVMTSGQYQNMVTKNPADSGKIMLYGQWLDLNYTNSQDIPDPVGKSKEVFEFTHRLLVDAANTWYGKL